MPWGAVGWEMGSLGQGGVCQELLPSAKRQEKCDSPKGSRGGGMVRDRGVMGEILGCRVCWSSKVQRQTGPFRTKEDAAVWGCRKGGAWGFPDLPKGLEKHCRDFPLRLREEMWPLLVCHPLS